MADDLLLVFTSPGPVDLAEFTDWYDNEHVPARLAVPGFGAITRLRAADGLAPEWAAAYEIAPGTLDTPAYQAVWDNASEREKRIMGEMPVLDRRVYSLLTDLRADGRDAAEGAPPALLAVSTSVPPELEAELTDYYEQEHYPLLLKVPGWRRARRFVLTAGDGPKYLSLHEIDSPAALEDPAFKAATSTPWRNKMTAAATARERRVFGLHRFFGPR